MADRCVKCGRPLTDPRSRRARVGTKCIRIYGSQQRGIPVQVNVIGTIIFVSAVGLVALSTLLSRRQRPDPVDAVGPAEIES